MCGPDIDPRMIRTLIGLWCDGPLVGLYKEGQGLGAPHTGVPQTLAVVVAASPLTTKP